MELLNLITAVVFVTTVLLLSFDYVWRVFSFPIRRVAPVAILVWAVLVWVLFRWLA